MRTQTRAVFDLFVGKKSQTELLGFAIVVLLIAVGMLFVIGFIVLDEKTNTRAAYLYKQTATNLNDALLETTTTCRQLTVRELYLACMEDTNNANDICPPVDFTIPTNTVPACRYLQGFISERLNETLGVLGYDYRYTYRYDNVVEAYEWIDKSDRSVAGCGNQRSTLVLSGSARQAIIYLDIYDCKRVS